MTNKVAAIVVAAGRGTRVGGEVPKQYRTILGESVIRRAVRLFAEHESIGLVQPVIHPADAERFAAAVAALRTLPPVAGGATRQESVRAGLEALASHAPDLVLVHDAARPFATPSLVSRAVAAVAAAQAAIPVLPVTDSTVSVSDADEVVTVLDRGPLRAVQTPQAFRFSLLLDAHLSAAAAGRNDFADDAAVAAFAGATVRTFRGEAGNVKLTTADDFVRAEHAMLSDVRTGSGYDVHAFGPGTAVMLGGVAIPHTQALAGHSDADVALHALTDAILGAIALGDIGAHFPPSDPQWRGASSDRFLAFAAAQVRRRGGIIAHLDLTIVCEAPRIGPYRDVMRARIAEISGLSVGRIAVKATTNERLGFLGRGEGIAALATATVRLPFGDDND